MLDDDASPWAKEAASRDPFEQVGGFGRRVREIDENHVERLPGLGRGLDEIDGGGPPHIRARAESQFFQTALKVPNGLAVLVHEDCSVPAAREGVEADGPRSGAKVEERSASRPVPENVEEGLTDFRRRGADSRSRPPDPPALGRAACNLHCSGGILTRAPWAVKGFFLT